MVKGFPGQLQHVASWHDLVHAQKTATVRLQYGSNESATWSTTQLKQLPWLAWCHFLDLHTARHPLQFQVGRNLRARWRCSQSDLTANKLAHSVDTINVHNKVFIPEVLQPYFVTFPSVKPLLWLDQGVVCTVKPAIFGLGLGLGCKFFVPCLQVAAGSLYHYRKYQPLQIKRPCFQYVAPLPVRTLQARARNSSRQWAWCGGCQKPKHATSMTVF
jgi:hypothetical protein